MLKVSKVVFVAFMQQCIKSKDLMAHISKLSKMYSVYTGPSPLQEERLFEERSILTVKQFTILRKQLC